MKIIRYAAPLLFVAIFFSSCQKEETTSVIPAITFNSFTPYADSAILVINFQDGDGDIGYPIDDANAVPNFWGEYLYQDSAQSITASHPVFIPLHVDNDTNKPFVTFTYHIPDITPSGKNKQLKGIIKVNMNPMWFFTSPFVTYPYIVEYKVWIVDRAGHKSNVIYTPPVNTQAY